MSTAGEALAVVDNGEERRFEATVGDGTVFLTYQRRDGRLVLLHTEVPRARRGEGVGSRFVRGVLDHIRSAGGTIVPRCAFVQKFLREHPEYQPLVHAG